MTQSQHSRCLVNHQSSSRPKGGSVSLQISRPRAQRRRVGLGRPGRGRQRQQCWPGRHGDGTGDGDGHRRRRGRHQRQDPPGGPGDLRQRGGHGQRLHHLQHQPVVDPRPLAVAALLAAGEPLRVLRPGRDGLLLAPHPRQRQPGGGDHQHHHTGHRGGPPAEQPAADAGELGLPRGDTAAERGLQEAGSGEGGVTGGEKGRLSGTEELKERLRRRDDERNPMFRTLSRHRLSDHDSQRIGS